ncbi:hypothetical protein [Burkholderia sp. HI2500]|uniref:hypothetical protein n=2 Tax=unclassified Burkholderia TaxID=2613784 RepID=UPI001180C26B|nr:hypothetical protein [Burkholderia sp. HI2500]
MPRHGGMPIGAFATRHNLSVTAGAGAERRLPNPDAPRPAETERASMRSTTRIAFIDGIECRVTINRHTPSGIHHEAIEPSRLTMTRAGQRCGCGGPIPAHGGNGVRESRRPAATLANAHVRQAANLVGSPDVVRSRQVQVEDV